MRLAVTVLFGVWLVAAPAAHAGVPTDEYAPLTVAVAGPLIPFTGTAGRLHLVYELHLTNASRAPATVLSVDVRDGATEARRVGVVAGAEVVPRMTLVGTGAATAALERGQTAILWLHLQFARKADMPKGLVHRLDVSAVTGPGGGEPRAATIIVGRAPVVIGPPLEGGGWVAGNGCCDGTGHRRAGLPLNGTFYLSQRTAIDWVRIDKRNRAISGEPAEGVPYVIDAFVLEGRVRSLDNLVDIGQTGAPVEVDRLSTPEHRRNELPLDLAIIAFPPAR